METVMSIAASLLPELEHEANTTRALLANIPDADAAWQPHPKSMSLGRLGAHLRDLAGWLELITTTTEFDMSPPGGDRWTSAPFTTTANVLTEFDAAIERGRAALAACTDAAMMEPWSLKAGGQAIFTLPRIVVLRTWTLNHMIHHRGQMSVYLRLRDVPLPSIYGPTADSAAG